MFLIDNIVDIAKELHSKVEATLTFEKVEGVVKLFSPIVFEVAEQVVIKVENEYLGEGDKRALAIQEIKKLLDEKIYNVPDMYDFAEEFIIGKVIDFVVKKLNDNGVFVHKEVQE